MSDAPAESQNDVDRSRRGRVLLVILAASLLHTVLRFTFMADVGKPPHVWRDRAAWWLPKAP
jgi:hypothetical protein